MDGRDASQDQGCICVMPNLSACEFVSEEGAGIAESIDKAKGKTIAVPNGSRSLYSGGLPAHVDVGCPNVPNVGVGCRRGGGGDLVVEARRSIFQNFDVSVGCRGGGRHDI